MKRIFISHSSKDRKYVEQLIDLIEIMGILPEKIFCTSMEGYGIPLGDNFLDRIKSELSEEVLVLFVLSNNFYSSPVCLCEMGATWIKTNMHIPVLIPPFDFCDIKGVIGLTQGMAINDSAKLNSLCNKIREIFDVQDFDLNRWERKKERFLSEVNMLAEQIPQTLIQHCSEEIEKYRINGDKKKYDILIKDVREKMNKLPWIVRKGLYYHFSQKDFILDPDEKPDEASYAVDAAEDDYLVIDGKWVTLNLRDPLLKKALESLDNLKLFLENASIEFHQYFEDKYEMCAKVESRKFWRVMELM